MRRVIVEVTSTKATMTVATINHASATTNNKIRHMLAAIASSKTRSTIQISIFRIKRIRRRVGLRAHQNTSKTTATTRTDRIAELVLALGVKPLEILQQAKEPIQFHAKKLILL